MRLILLSLLVLLFCTTTYCQEYIIGYRIGPIKNFDGNQPTRRPSFKTFENGIYYRYNSKGRISLDIGVSYHEYREQSGPQIIFDAGYNIYDSKLKLQMLDFQYAIQYNITPKSYQRSGVLKHVDHYMGIVLGHRSCKITDTSYTKDWGTDLKREQVHKSGDISAFAGVNYTLSYTFNRLILQSTSTILTNSSDFGFLSSDYYNFPSSRLSINFGIGYNLHKEKNDVPHGTQAK
ncbi:MAG: hypothetical protein KDC07_11240 [Chitinophagaceae bacterium]|nr:hypothetical protein [Chitinophagaceae bacterium]